MKEFKKYLVPSLIASVLMSMYVIVDGIFVGQKIGDLGLAAINISWPITAFLQAVGTALGLSGGIYISTLKGKNDSLAANKIKLTVLLWIVVLAVFLGIIVYIFNAPLLRLLGASDNSFPYAQDYIVIILSGSVFQMLGVGLLPLLKNSGKIKSAMTASLLAVGVNLLLDYVFIFIMDLNLAGAALGSVLAQVVACTVCIVAYFKELKGVDFSLKTTKTLFGASIAPFILNYSYSIIIIITNIVCAHYSQDEGVAAYTLLSYISYIVIAIACAIGDSIQPLFSYYEAANEYKKNYKMLRHCIYISFGICAVISILTFVFSKPLGFLYNLSDTAFLYYEDGLIFYCVSFLFISVLKVISSYLYAVNDKKLANILIMLDPFILTPLFLSVCSIVFTLKGVWISYLIVQCILFIISMLFAYIKCHRKLERTII